MYVVSAASALLALVVAIHTLVAWPVASKGRYVPSPVMTRALGDIHVGERLDAEWRGASYPVTVLAVLGRGEYRIHYDGWDSSWDEVIGASRILGRR